MTEEEYGRLAGAEHLRRFGQYFTPPKAAEFMARWACPGAERVLDPAVGNSVFLKAARQAEPSCRLFGCELDPAVLDSFGNPTGAEVCPGDYMTSGWEERYDAILCNPPYGRFQSVDNRTEALEEIFRHTGVRYSRYTNLYALFLLKSIHQLSRKGRLAYLIPSEFLNSRYGEPIKRLLVEQKLLRAILRFEEDRALFPNAVTTCCILLLDREEKEVADFCQIGRPEDLTLPLTGGRHIPYKALKPGEKWRGLFCGEEAPRSGKLCPLSRFCTVSRGIATGANSFYCLTKQQAEAQGLSPRDLTPCVCRSAQVEGPVFTEADFERLSRSGKPCFLLDVRREPDKALRTYLEQGRAQGVDRRYIPARRKPWYSVEQKAAAPIWASSACRGSIRFIRNLAGVKQLTTFHGITMKEDFSQDADLLFCTLLAPSVQKLLLENRKEMGGGLQKFQPNDLNTALTVDLPAISQADRQGILAIYEELKAGGCPRMGERLDRLLAPYLE